MGFLSSLFGVKTMNADPIQQQFARLLIEAAETGGQVQVINWLIQQPWSPSETRNRIAHAVSITKISSVPATYERVKQIGLQLTQASYRLG
jgi:hypothetical protein